MKDKARNGNNDALMERVVQAGKCKEKNLESSSNFIKAAVCRFTLQQGDSTTLSIQYVIFTFLALSSNVHITHAKVLFI